jgi:phosphopantetheine adenylyltransferase
MTTERLLRLILSDTLANNETTTQGLEMKTERFEEVDEEMNETKRKEEFYLLGYNAM